MFILTYIKFPKNRCNSKHLYIIINAITFLCFIHFTQANISLDYIKTNGKYKLSMLNNTNDENINEETDIEHKYIDINGQSSVFYIPSLGTNNYDYQRLTLIKKEENVLARQVRNEFRFKNKYDNNIIKLHYNVYVLKNNYTNHDNESIPLPIQYNELQFSFLHEAFNQKLIDKLSFTIEPKATHQEGVIHFGSIPKTLTANKNKHTCINDNYLYWGCNLNYIYFGEYGNYSNLYEIKSKVKFHSDSSLFYVPKSFLEWTEMTIFKDGFDEHVCTKKTLLHYTFIECKCEYFHKVLENVFFSFDDKEFRFNTTEIYDVFGAGGECLFYFIYNIKIKDENLWSFGTFFLDEYVTQFDYDKKSVTFYTHQEVYKGRDFKGSINNNKFLLVITMVIIVLGIGFNVISLIKRIK